MKEQDIIEALTITQNKMEQYRIKHREILKTIEHDFGKLDDREKLLVSTAYWQGIKTCQEASDEHKKIGKI